MSDILNDLQPRLAAGETRQGFLSARFVPARGEQRVLNDSYASVRLRHVLKWVPPMIALFIFDAGFIYRIQGYDHASLHR
jgi:hypothetical protein